MLTIALRFGTRSPINDFWVFSWMTDCTLEFVSTSLITIRFWFRFGLDEVMALMELLIGECLMRIDCFKAKAAANLGELYRRF